MKTTSADMYMCLGSAMAINTHNGKHSCQIDILDALTRNIEHATCRHSKVLAIFAQLHTEEYTANNKSISTLMHEIRKYVQRHYKSSFRYVWVREQEKAKKQHYHVLILVDGNKIYDSRKIINWIDYYWKVKFNGHSFRLTNPYYRFKRCDLNQIKPCFYRASYLAKIRGKGYQGKHARNYSASK
jgi:hypothetical protein